LSSTELIQKEKAGDEDGEGDPEVDVGGNRTKQIAGTFSFAGRHRSLGMEVAESGVPS
jgi:hypothetical protein